ncbi:hypothetical protein ACJX0J_040250, partial [Zea mays]
ERKPRDPSAKELLCIPILFLEFIMIKNSRTPTLQLSLENKNGNQNDVLYGKYKNDIEFLETFPNREKFPTLGMIALKITIKYLLGFLNNIYNELKNVINK